jgi:hypothetical protein
VSARATLPALVAAALAVAAPARAAEPAPAREGPRTALDALRVAGVSLALVEVVEERVCAAIGEASPGEVVCPADVAAASALAKSAMMFGECSADECLRRVDRARSADRRVGGTLERGEKGIVISLHLASPAGPGPTVVETLPEDLDALVARIPPLVRKLLGER